jgi:hypothetical protein
VVAFRYRKFLHATAGGGVGGIDAEYVLVARFRLIEFPQIISSLCGVKQATHGIHLLGMGGGECGIGADRIVELRLHREGTGIIWGDGLGEDPIHCGFGSG